MEYSPDTEDRALGRGQCGLDERLDSLQILPHAAPRARGERDERGISAQGRRGEHTDAFRIAA